MMTHICTFCRSVCDSMKCAKFRRSCAIVGLVNLVPSCHRAFFGPKNFLVGISWVSNFLSWVFCVSKIFYRGYFVGTRFFLVGISWVQYFMIFNKR